MARLRSKRRGLSTTADLVEGEWREVAVAMAGILLHRRQCGNYVMRKASQNFHCFFPPSPPPHLLADVYLTNLLLEFDTRTGLQSHKAPIREREVFNFDETAEFVCKLIIQFPNAIEQPVIL